MGRKASVNRPNTINIKSVSVQVSEYSEHTGAYKFSNDDWNTIAFSIPREDLSKDKKIKFADRELNYNGIYFLFGYEDGHEVVYVGQASKRANGKSALARLREHHDSTTEPNRDKWSWAVAVTNEDDKWGSTELDALESYFINEIQGESNLNGREQNNAGADLSLYVDKVTQIKALITAIGFKIFDDIPEKESIQVTDNSPVEDLHNGMARIPEIVTPDRVVKAMVDMLPAEVWDSNTKFLDPACKGGEYLREIYDRLMETESIIADYPDTITRSNHILKEQIYGIALSQVSLDRTTKRLFGEDRNLRIIPGYIEILKRLSKIDEETQKKNHIDIESIFKKVFGGEMEFNVVIGNPPYQENDGSGLDGGSALYDKFMQIGDNVSDMVCMVVPMRWMTQYRVRGINSEWVKKELNCNKYTHLLYAEESMDIFKGVNIRGGIMYFIKDRYYSGKCKVGTIGSNVFSERYLASADDIDVFIINDIEEHILEKTHSKESFDSIVGSTNEFGLESNTVTVGTSLKLFKSFGEVDSCDLYELPKGHELVPMYKVIIGRTFGSGKKGERLPVPRILEPNEVCTGSLLMIGKSFNRIYCENVAKYMQTKFMALLVGMRKSTHNATREAYKFVPLQDFTSNSDIDWSQSISDIDKQLYKKYNLSDEEIEYIEKTIKPMQ